MLLFSFWGSTKKALPLESPLTNLTPVTDIIIGEIPSITEIEEPPVYPTDIPQPLGNAGWGYRDPEATYKTLLWEQDTGTELIPAPEPQIPHVTNLFVPSAPVPIKEAPLGQPHPPPINGCQRPVAQDVYTSW